MNCKTIGCCLLSLLSLAACRSPKTGDTADSEFKMIVRLWPDHHNDTLLLEELLSAVEKYPDACDEVWLTYPRQYRRCAARPRRRVQVESRGRSSHADHHVHS